MIKKLLDLIKGKGIRLGISTGKPFDPTDQKRTDPLEDIAKNKEKKK